MFAENKRYHKTKKLGGEIKSLVREEQVAEEAWKCKIGCKCKKQEGKNCVDVGERLEKRGVVMEIRGWESPLYGIILKWREEEICEDLEKGWEGKCV